MKTKFTRLLSIATISAIAFSCTDGLGPDKDDDHGNQEQPEGQTLKMDVETITCYSAVVTLDGDKELIERIKVSFSAKTDDTDKRTAAVVKEKNSYRACLTGLYASMKYSVEAVETDSDGNSRTAKVCSFTTPDENALVTGDASDVREHSATVSCLLDLSEGIYENVRYGVAYNPGTVDPIGNGSALALSDNLSGTSFSAVLKDLAPGMTYTFRAWADIDGAIHYGEAKVFETILEVNEAAEVDLGLSVIWSGTNLGASSASEYRRYYYAWGETSWHEGSYDWMCYSDKEYNKMPLLICGNGTYDAATAALGNGWRMPTRSELEELISKCDIRYIEEFTDSKDITSAGFLVSGPSGQTIFIPAGGMQVPTSGTSQAGTYAYLWSGEVYEDEDHVHDKSYSLTLWKDGSPSVGTSDRFCGLAIRAVKDRD